MPKGFKGFQKGELNPSYSEEARARLSALRRGSVTSEETRLAISKTLRKVLKRPEMRKKWALAKEGTVKSEKTRAKMSRSGRKRTKKLSSCMHYADAAFSKYIRLKYSDSNGFVSCFTCEAHNYVGEMDCGHFVSRQHKSLRWSELNSHPQCKNCNRFNEGRKDVYAVKLMEKYGPDILVRLQEEKREIVHLNREMLLDIAREFKAKAKAILERNTGVPANEYHPFIDPDVPVGPVAVEPD